MDLSRVAHIGVETTALIGAGYLVTSRISGLEEELIRLRKQLSHLAVYIKHQETDYQQQLKQLKAELTAQHKQKERTSNRNLLRSIAIEERESPSPEPEAEPETVPATDLSISDDELKVPTD